MTYPPQWSGAPGGHPRQPYPPQPYPQQYQHFPAQGHPPQYDPYGGPPPKPGALGVVMTIHWVITALTVGGVVISLASSLSLLHAVNGLNLAFVALLALITVLLGVLHAVAAMSAAHRYFPNLIASRMAAGFSLVLGALSLRSIVTLGALTASALIGVGMVLLCLTALILGAQSSVKRWIVAKHRYSISQGHLPRNARRR
ncbi:hypothetical protein GCM10022243_39400 [Saccharothrix violaceirubra]|uniref:Uncharacterized protein n=1 Tax=Saccharothrix violaceirubra TaxID=413306 RepID=A0A7W7WUN2_9PSEU|nr:hypothetical protein [Saccharothrix violaceirubra]MBB4964276.1 hypothetical protein [Saccharothrix violaceirubra]